ncbi:MAG: PAS domain S-box protein [Snowella sp.]|nr:PAS domain S-box protein [Snowella sp.]
MSLVPKAIERIIDKFPRKISRNTLLRDAIAIMGKEENTEFPPTLAPSPDTPPLPPFSYLVVLENEKFWGLLTSQDVVRWVTQGIDLDKTRLHEVLTRSTTILPPSQLTDLVNLLQFFQQHSLQYLPIVDQSEGCVGVISGQSLYQNIAPELLYCAAKTSDTTTNLDLLPVPNDCASIELTLQTNQNYLDTIVSNISEGILILSQDGEIIFANRAAGEMFSLPTEQLVGVNLGIPINSEKLFEMEILRRNGEVGIGEVQVVPVVWDQRSRYLISLRDITARTEANNELWQSQERYRSLTEVVPNLVWLTDDEGEIAEINQRAQQYLGQSLIEIRKKGWFQAIHSDDLNLAKESALRGEALKEAYSLECRLRRADGVYRWHLVQVLPIGDELGQTTRWLGSCTDIEDLKQTESLLQQKAEQESLIKNITQRIRESLDLKAILNTTVEEVRQVLQVDRVVVYQVFTGGTGAIIAESVVEGWLQILNRALPSDIFPEQNYSPYAKGRIFVLEDRDDGQIIECLANFLREIQVKAELVVPIVQKDQLWGLIVAHQCSRTRHWQESEINILRQIALQLAIAIQQSELYEQLQHELQQRKTIEAERQKLDLVVENSSEFMAVADLNGQLVFLNRAGQYLIGLEDPNLLSSLTMLDFFDPQERSLIQEEILPRIFRKGQWEGELHLKHFQTGQTIPVLCNAFLIKDPKTEQPTHIAGVIRDITRIKQAEQEIRNALEKEKELNDLRSRFITMASHEFRTPLSIINSSAGIMSTYHERLSEEKKRQHLQRIQDSVQHMTTLLDDVLMMSRAEAEKIAFNPQPLNVIAFCRDLVTELQLSSNEHTITFHLQNATQDSSQETRSLIVNLDPKLLRQIFTNLLNNAIKYSPNGGNITFNLQLEADNLIFEIQDQGIGIPTEDLQQLFTAFHRATNTGNIQGTGLGLAIVKRCVDLHQGIIEVDSHLDQGTVFTLTLPRTYSL